MTAPVDPLRHTDAARFGSVVSERVAALTGPEAQAAARRRLHRKGVVIAVWFVASYVALVAAPAWWIGVPAGISMALVMAAIGFSVQHDANHNAYFPADDPATLTPRNRLVGYSMNLLGANSRRWIEGHVLGHHAAPNVLGVDEDIELAPIGRLTPDETRLPWQRYQHLYLWFAYALTALAFPFEDVYVMFVAARNPGRFHHDPKPRDVAAVVVWKVVVIGALVGVPMLFHPWWLVLGSAAAILGVLGVLIACVFQVAHTVDDVTYAVKGQRRPRWHEWQVRSTVDFCHGDGPVDRTVTWFIGGLNYQIEHHLFPYLPHTILPEIAPVVAETCAEFGIPYTVRPTVRAALAGHYRLLKRLGAASPGADGGDSGHAAAA